MNASSLPVVDLHPADRESVWSHPTRPSIDSAEGTIVVMHSGAIIARSTRALRVRVMGHPPTYFLPAEDVKTEHLALTAHQRADTDVGVERFFDVRVGRRRAVHAAWAITQPTPGCEALKGHVAFFAGRLDRCLVDGELVVPEPGGVRGGWITSAVSGPFATADTAAR